MERTHTVEEGETLSVTQNHTVQEMGSIRGPLEEAIEESSGDPSEIYRLVASKIFKVPCEEVTEGMENSIKKAVFSEMYGGKPELVKEK